MYRWQDCLISLYLTRGRNNFSPALHILLLRVLSNSNTVIAYKKAPIDCYHMKYSFLNQGGKKLEKHLQIPPLKKVIMIFGFLCLCFRAANALSSVVAIKPGDRVMAILPRIPEFFLMQVACLRTGISFPRPSIEASHQWQCTC